MSTYPGGKEGCHQKLINLIPPHQVYIEPFLGGGAIMRFKRPATLSIGIELNEEVLWQTALKCTPDPIVIDGEPAGGDFFRWASNLRQSSEKYIFMHYDALKFLRWLPMRTNQFIYCDPPYLRSTRKSQAALYDHEFWTEEEHKHLLDILLGLESKVMISGYHSELYADVLKGWHHYKFDAMTRGGGLAEEWVWMNYDPPTLLHDYRYLGENFRERERIKRKKTRWLNRFQKTDPQERAAILWALAESGIVNQSLFELASPEAASMPAGTSSSPG
jgi:DNA adenine methylase